MLQLKPAFKISLLQIIGKGSIEANKIREKRKGG